jgi:predicted MFS family arabinose efflux permease
LARAHRDGRGACASVRGTLCLLNAALLADALTFMASLLSLAAVRTRVHASARHVSLRMRGLAGDFRAGIRYLRSVRILVILTAIQIVVNLCLATEKLIFYFAKETLGLSSLNVGIATAAGGIGGMLGALGAARLAEWIGQIRLVVCSIVAAGLAIGAMSITYSLLTLTSANLLYGWALVVASPVIRTLRQQIVPRELLGRITSTLRVLFLAVDPLGVVIAGALTISLGGNPRPVFLGAGVIITVVALVGWLAGLRTHQDEVPDARTGRPQSAGRMRD